MRWWLLCLLVCGVGLLHAQRISLNQGWEFYDDSTQQWLPATVPGNIHQDLFLNGRIPHPFQGDNESRVQWVGDRGWQYRLRFTLPDSMRNAKRIVIRFESLDTYASLNMHPKDQSIGSMQQAESRNMFVPLVWDITSLVHPSQVNEVLLTFSSATSQKELLTQEPLVAVTAGNDAAQDKFSPFVRKAPYHFGWDWGPRIVTQGIRGNVWLEVMENPSPPQPIQLPKVELVREQDSIGESYFFRINGKSVFMRGANYIPADEYFPEGRQAHIRELLLSAKEAGFNMIRVWGGGIYEEDYFYDLCDSLGLYVWQDFMFACSMYSGEEDFMENVQEEAEAQVMRLRHHPCIVLWCGNNEIEVAWKNWGWQQQFGIHAEDSVRMWHNYQYLFDTLLPEVVHRLDPNRPYVSTSPLSNWGAIERFRSGDNHYWGVWHGEEPFENFRTFVPRFMSEYGFQSFPDIEMMQAWGAPRDTSLLRWHQKSYKGSRMILQYGEEWFGKPDSLPEQIRHGQFAQAEAYRIAIESHRAAAPRCMGTLYWQLNDCWPGPSWSTLDYALNWKPAHYMVKRMYADRLPLAARTDSSLTLSVSNFSHPELIRGFEWQVADFKGRLQKSAVYPIPATPSLRLEGEVLDALTKGVSGKREYVRIKLITDKGILTVLHFPEEKPSEMHLPRNPGISFTSEWQPDGSVQLVLTAKKFAKGVWLEIPVRDAKGKLLYRFSDNYFDLEAGEVKRIQVIPTTAVGISKEAVSKLRITHCNR